MKIKKKRKIIFGLTTIFLLVTPLFFKSEKKSLSVSEVYNIHGISTSLFEVKNTNVVFVKFKIKDAGVLHNSEKLHGISLVLSSLMFRKMANLSEKQTREKLQSLTVFDLKINAISDDFEISFYALKDHFTEALEFISSAIVHPNFSEHDLEYVKSMYPKVIDLETSTPYEIMNDELIKLLFCSSGYGLNQTGTTQGIAAIKANDIQEFIDKNFTKSRFHVFIVGDLSRFDALQYLNTFFEKLSNASNEYVPEFAAEESKKSEKHIYKKEMEDIAGITIGVRLDELSDEQKAAANVVVSTLFSDNGDFKKSLEKENINCVTNASLMHRTYSSILQITSYVNKKDLQKYIDFALSKLKKYSSTQNIVQLDVKKSYLQKLSQIGIENFAEIDEKIEEQKLPYMDVSEQDFAEITKIMFDVNHVKIITISSDAIE